MKENKWIPHETKQILTTIKMPEPHALVLAPPAFACPLRRPNEMLEPSQLRPRPCSFQCSLFRFVSIFHIYSLEEGFTLLLGIIVFAKVCLAVSEKQRKQVLAGSCASRKHATTNRWFSASQPRIQTDLWTIEVGFEAAFEILHEKRSRLRTRGA